MIVRLLALGVAAAFAAGPAHADTFVYRGELHDGGVPADGIYQLRLTVYGSERAAVPVAGPLELLDVRVADGRFSVDVELDMLPVGFTQGWVEVAVKARGDADYAALPGRAGFETTATVCPESWALAGNAFSNSAVNFVGTTDDQPLVLRANNQVGFRVVPGIVPSVIGGRSDNGIAPGTRGVAIGGGGSGLGPNRTSGNFSTIAGGEDNEVVGEHGAIGGGTANFVAGSASVVGGGESNRTSGFLATVGGGIGNHAMGDMSVVGGGQGNLASAPISTVSGGTGNVGSGVWSAVPGGYGNCAGGVSSWAGGRFAKVRPAWDPGDGGSCSGLGSYPGNTGDDGTFVWADSRNSYFVSTGSDQFMVRASGGVAINAPPVNDQVELTLVADDDGFNYANLFMRARDVGAGVLLSVGDASSTGANDAGIYFDQFNDIGGQVRRLTVAGNGDFIVTAAAFKPGGGSWSTLSDARLKTDVQALDGALSKLLELRGVRFRYADPAPMSRPPGEHAGFVAQQVAEVFPGWVGTDAEGYLTVGTQGFEALVVEALRQLNDDNAALRSELAQLRAVQAGEIAELRAQLAMMRAAHAPVLAGGER